MKIRQDTALGSILGIAMAAILVATAMRPMPSPEKAAIGFLGLPYEAKSIISYGNGWHTFSLTIDGKERRFLRRSGGVAECLVELRD